MSFFKRGKQSSLSSTARKMMEEAIKDAVASDTLTDGEGAKLSKLCKKDPDACAEDLRKRHIFVSGVPCGDTEYSADSGQFWKRWGVLDSSKTLGEGRAHVQVYLGVSRKNTNKRVAIKCCRRVDLATELSDRGEITKSVTMTDRIRPICPFLARFEDWGIDDKNLYMVYELIDGKDLFSTIVDRAEEGKTWTEGEARKVMLEFVTGLEAMHNANCYHRDLKPENLMVESHANHIKIIDFGTCALNRDRSLSSIGSALYSAPEQMCCGKLGHKWILSQGHDPGTMGAYDPEAADLFSIGSILYPLLSGMLPFESVEDWCNFGIDMSMEEWDDISDQAKDLIRRCMARDPAKRPTCREVLQHPWMRSREKGVHLPKAVDGMAKIVGLRTRIQVKTWQWKVMDMHSTHHGEPNIYCVDHDIFIKKYRSADPFEPCGPDPEVRKLAMERGMKQYHALTEFRTFVKVGPEQLSQLHARFPKGRCKVVRNPGEERSIQIDSGEAADQLAVHKFVLENPGLFPTVQAIKNDIYAVQQVKGAPDDEVTTLHDDATVDEEFAFNSPWKAADGSWELCFVAPGDYLAVYIKPKPEIYRLEGRAWRLNYSPVDRAMKAVSGKRREVLELEKQLHNLDEQRHEVRKAHAELDAASDVIKKKIQGLRG
jgi:hypothetical protein